MIPLCSGLFIGVVIIAVVVVVCRPVGSWVAGERRCGVVSITEAVVILVKVPIGAINRLFVDIGVAVVVDIVADLSGAWVNIRCVGV